MIRENEFDSDSSFVARVTPSINGFLERLRTSRKDDSPMTAVWNLDGLAETIIPLEEACNL